MTTADDLAALKAAAAVLARPSIKKAVADLRTLSGQLSDQHDPASRVLNNWFAQMAAMNKVIAHRTAALQAASDKS